MSTNPNLIQTRRRRATVLTCIRQNQEQQLARMDDFEIWAFLQDIGSNMSLNQVVTMLQDLQTLGLVDFEQAWNEARERVVVEKIKLTAIGLGVTTRRRNTEEVLFD